MKTKHEMSKTFQYRKVMKPLIERKRRARINKCLDDLKDLMADCLQQQNNNLNVKFEKADILELTVEHLRKIKTQSTNTHHNHQKETSNNFRCGYIKAANEVSICLASLPSIDVDFGTKLMTHLGARLNQLESSIKYTSSFNKPLSINCENVRKTTSVQLYSPVSSGYASENEYVSITATLEHKLQAVSPLWRPW